MEFIPFMTCVCCCAPVWSHHGSQLLTTVFNQRYSITRFPPLQVVTSNTFADILKSDKLSHSWLEENKVFVIRLTESWRNTCVCFHRETPWRSYHYITGTRNIFPVWHQDNFNSASHQLLKTVKLPGRKTRSVWSVHLSHRTPLPLSALVSFSLCIPCLLLLTCAFSLCVVISYSWILALSNYPDFVNIPEPPRLALQPAACLSFAWHAASLRSH